MAVPPPEEGNRQAGRQGVASSPRPSLRLETCIAMILLARFSAAGALKCRLYHPFEPNYGNTGCYADPNLGDCVIDTPGKLIDRAPPLGPRPRRGRGYA
jgi:hypothetical protein